MHTAMPLGISCTPRALRHAPYHANTAAVKQVYPYHPERCSGEEMFWTQPGKA